jgi:hypothetical protein
VPSGPSLADPVEHLFVPRRAGPTSAILVCVLLVDAANVVGSRPTGWWRDRPGAARGLVEEIRAAAAASRLPTPVVVVLEGAARRGAEEGLAAGVQVVHAPEGGDDTLVALGRPGSSAGPPGIRG